ncbi:MAG: hypothetical protein P4L74_00100 [Candidatus Doudnabacteria bacterium]|nr:hypothetical protein [Candidatus Doudnabacteria bacterium]
MEKFAIEIETSAGWINYHRIMRPGLPRAQKILKELRERHPQTNFRIVKWTGEVVSD